MSPAPTIEASSARAVELRHRLHRIPELGYEEHETAKAIRAELSDLGIEHIAGVADAPTATICIIGDQSRPCVALRADIDALPILEDTGLSYASIHRGKMHACGHDGHSATLLGAAAALNAVQGDLPVCVKLFWQPAEEGGGGAERLVRAGVLDGRLGPKVRAVFGLHGWPGLPVGCVATRPGPLLAATDTFKVTFIGKGCHGAFPHLGVDPIVAAAEAVVSLQQLISRDIDPTEPAVVTIGMIRGGTATNIIPDEAIIEGTTRTLGEPVRKFVQSVVVRRCNAVAAAAGCTAKIEWTPGYPATINDPPMTDYVARIAAAALGPDRFIPAARPSMGGEDFAYYLQEVPGCFFLLGVQPHGQSSYPSLHSDKFDFPDAAIPVGIRMFTELVRNFPT